MAEPVRYSLSWQDANDHLFDIAIAFTAPVDEPRLHLPAWRPGRYAIQNYAANVRQWSAEGEGGRALAIRKDGKSSWRIQARRGEDVTVRYRYFAGILDAGSSFLDASEAYFNGTNLFMWIDGLRDQTASLVVHVPESWAIETQLPRRSDGTFLARDYDHLIDSPTIASASLVRHAFEENGATIHLVFTAADRIDTGQFVEPLRAIVRSQAALFGGLPFSEYRFLFHGGDRWHGVEHEESCSIVFQRTQLLNAKKGDDAYDHLLSIASHELFHVWNVKRIIPALFLPYDYTAETTTRLLWAMEGITSYYGDLTLARCGVWDVPRYLEHLRKEMQTLEGLPGREVMSLAQASFDSWLHDPSHMHDKANAWFSFYNKGELVAAVLDLTIRSKTAGAHSLDDVIRAMWEEYGRSVQEVIQGGAGAHPRGLEEDAIERIAGRVTGLDLRELFEHYVEGTDPLPYAELLAWAGVEWSAAPEPRIELGVRARASERCLIADSIIAGAPAAEAGMLPGDEIVAVGRERTASDADLVRALAVASASEPTEILFARNGTVRSAFAVLRSDPVPRIALRLIESPTSEQRAFRDAWLG
ncbi:MAG TPA: PDZ domain-containing protein [Thermoanaerobaculia bacterium]|nr:PDZ domain-containing protein [Thermoanaerobaculia bacterium]